ncbi:hypothetical protein ACFWP3_38180 [Streptomyces sp. NPDC058525]
MELDRARALLTHGVGITDGNALRAAPFSYGVFELLPACPSG